MQIWVDADACPRAIKEILFRAAERVCIPLTLVANKPLWTPPSKYIQAIRVSAGFDVADSRIVQGVVITSYSIHYTKLYEACREDNHTGTAKQDGYDPADNPCDNR